MKNVFLVASVFFFTTYVNGQYYYLDIVGTKQTNQTYKLLRAFQYKRINATSFEGNAPSKDFVLEQTITPDGRQIITRSASIGNTESFFISQYQNNRVVKTVDSSRNAINTVLYEYDNAGRLTATHNTSEDFDGTFKTSESHIWTYNDKGLPEKMLKIKNKTDTTLVTFTFDDQDNVAEEKWIKNHSTLENYYYYYNPKKQLTDVVRFNRKAKAMLPDFMFEYDAKGHIAQMTQTQKGTANYLVWKYLYNEDGIKQKEVVYNKQKEMLGRIEYSYQ
jgi:YD repeat-containing protein